LQVNLFRRRIQQIEAADDMVNLLQVIINDHGKLIGDNPVFALDDKIAVLLGEVMGNQALQLILKGNDTVIGFNAFRIRAIRKDLPVSANAGVYIGLCLASIASRQCFSAACTGVDQAVFLQIVDDIVVNVDMSALIINLAVPMQAKSLQGFQDGVGGTCHVSGGVEVVNA